jgi:predicted outer membrane repeat protein
LAIVPTLAASTTIRVDAGGGSDYVSIGEAALAASPGDTILVAPGTYAGPSNRDVEFPHADLRLVSEAGAGVTLIDCESEGRALSIQKPGATVRGFTFAAGAADEGGAIWVGATSPTIVDCRFVGNSADAGGALYCALGSSPDFERCVFEGNSASSYGGAVYLRGAHPFFYECEFEENAAGVNGGAISLKHGALAWLMECAFRRNTAQDGGAIYVGSLSLWWWEEEEERTTIGFSTFTGNEAERGGALFVNARCRVEVIWCTLTQNRATRGGALYGVTNDPIDVFLQSSTLFGNAARYGGGVCTAGWFWNPDWCEFRISRSIIAFCEQGNAICRLEDSYAHAEHSIAYGNAGGDWLYGGDQNIYGDPLFCGVHSGDFALCENSQARPDNNPWNVLMGASSASCGPCDSPVREASWGRIKARYR